MIAKTDVAAYKMSCLNQYACLCKEYKNLRHQLKEYKRVIGFDAILSLYNTLNQDLDHPSNYFYTLIIH